MTLHFRSSLLSSFRSCGRAEVSTIVVATFSGVPILGGIVIWGRTGWIFVVTKTSLTSDLGSDSQYHRMKLNGIPKVAYVMRLDLPVPSSPQRHIRTE